LPKLKESDINGLFMAELKVKRDQIMEEKKQKEKKQKELSQLKEELDEKGKIGQALNHLQSMKYEFRNVKTFYHPWETYAAKLDIPIHAESGGAVSYLKHHELEDPELIALARELDREARNRHTAEIHKRSKVGLGRNYVKQVFQSDARTNLYRDLLKHAKEKDRQFIGSDLRKDILRRAKIGQAEAYLRELQLDHDPNYVEYARKKDEEKKDSRVHREILRRAKLGKAGKYVEKQGPMMRHYLAYAQARDRESDLARQILDKAKVGKARSYLTRELGITNDPSNDRIRYATQMDSKFLHSRLGKEIRQRAKLALAEAYVRDEMRIEDPDIIEYAREMDLTERDSDLIRELGERAKIAQAEHYLRDVRKITNSGLLEHARALDLSVNNVSRAAGNNDTRQPHRRRPRPIKGSSWEKLRERAKRPANFDAHKLRPDFDAMVRIRKALESNKAALDKALQAIKNAKKAWDVLLYASEECNVLSLVESVIDGRRVREARAMNNDDLLRDSILKGPGPYPMYTEYLVLYVWKRATQVASRLRGFFGTEDPIVALGHAMRDLSATRAPKWSSWSLFGRKSKTDGGHLYHKLFMDMVKMMANGEMLLRDKQKEVIKNLFMSDFMDAKVRVPDKNLSDDDLDDLDDKLKEEMEKGGLDRTLDGLDRGLGRLVGVMTKTSSSYVRDNANAVIMILFHGFLASLAFRAAAYAYVSDNDDKRRLSEIKKRFIDLLSTLLEKIHVFGPLDIQNNLKSLKDLNPGPKIIADRLELLRETHDRLINS
jgi:hypothetical protein